MLPFQNNEKSELHHVISLSERNIPYKKEKFHVHLTVTDISYLVTIFSFLKLQQWNTFLPGQENVVNVPFYLRSGCNDHL